MARPRSPAVVIAVFVAALAVGLYIGLAEALRGGRHTSPSIQAVSDDTD